MSNNKAVARQSGGGLIESLAGQICPEMDPKRFYETIKKTCIPESCKNVSDEQFAAFLMVAKEHGFNPLTKEIYAFPSKGGIVPVVGVDGWIRKANEHPQFDGMENEDIFNEDGGLAAHTCRIYRKDRKVPQVVTEYLDECRRPTDPWKSHPKRMLRHKATIQAIRYAFGFAGVYDPDEAERIVEVNAGPIKQLEYLEQYPSQQEIKDGLKRCGASPAELRQLAEEEYGVERLEKLSRRQFKDLCEKVNEIEQDAKENTNAADTGESSDTRRVEQPAHAGAESEQDEFPL